MSKTLFNQNTFQSKNVTNSDDVQDLKVDTFKATTLTATTIVNTELQNATAGVAANTSAISGFDTAISANTTAIAANTASIANKEDAFSVDGITLIKTTTVTPNFLSINVDNDAGITIGSNKLIYGGGIYQYLLDNYNPLLTTGDGIDITGTTITFDGTISQDITTGATNTIQAGFLKYIDSGVVTDVKTKIDTNTTAIAGKQATLSTGDGIDITGNTISFDGTISQAITTSSAITGGTMNYVNGGVVTNIQTEIESKQNILTDTDNAGTNISISATGVISATSGGGTYTALANGGLAVNGSNEFSLDFANTNSTITIPQRLEITDDTTTQLLVKPASDVGVDAAVTIRGARNGTTAVRQAQLRFENYDNDLTATNDLFELAGKVTNATTNIGGMLISNYADGSTRSENTTMSADGNWYFKGGGTFQDVYGMRFGGTAYFDGAVTFASTISLTQPITQDIDVGAKITTNQLLVDTANSISTTGSSDTAVNISEGLLLMDAGTGNGQTAGNGVIQIQCRNSGKLSEGMCMRAIDNNNNCINFRSETDSARGRIDGDGGSKVKYRTSSDVRLKENIEDMDSCWELLKTAQPRKFRWIEDGTDDVGFIAQEIYAMEGFSTLKPTTDKYNCCDNSLNTFDEDGYCENPMESEGVIYPHALDYGNFTPYLWKALQEAITKIETLETKVANLEAQIIV